MATLLFVSTFIGFYRSFFVRIFLWENTIYYEVWNRQLLRLGGDGITRQRFCPPHYPLRLVFWRLRSTTHTYLGTN